MSKFDMAYRPSQQRALKALGIVAYQNKLEGAVSGQAAKIEETLLENIPQTLIDDLNVIFPGLLFNGQVLLLNDRLQLSLTASPTQTLILKDLIDVNETPFDWPLNGSGKTNLWNKLGPFSEPLDDVSVQ